MPPVMGAAAFIMAEFTGIAYSKIIIAAAIPAILYYFAVGTMVHLEASKLGLKGLPREMLPSIRQLLISKGYLLIPLISVIVFLVTGNTPTLAAFKAIAISIIVAIIVALVKKISPLLSKIF
jgi:TRAP-type uncharacterized transport system, fused permease components